MDAADADTDSDTDDESTDPDDRGEFAAEVERARALLDPDVDALFVGAIRDGEVETTFAQRADDADQEALQPLGLLAAHLQLVSRQAGVEPSTVAGDAATLAGQVEEIPASTDSLPDEE